MRKIVTLFCRNYETDFHVRPEIVPGAEWVLAGEGVATRKWDGACCLVQGGQLLKRHELKPGRRPPAGFVPVTGVDPNTGKRQGWLPVTERPEDRWFHEAFVGDEPEGTYELCGPKVQGNPEGLSAHVLLPHGGEILDHAPRSYSGLKTFFALADLEGVVWHHPDGRMVKLKIRDFGFSRLSLAV